MARKEELNEAMYWQKERNGIRCVLCGRECFIAKDKTGFCQVRFNKDNKLYALNYGKVIGVTTNKIEKAPLFHFYPNSDSLFFGIPGCNFFSQFCPTFEINQKLHEKSLDEVKYKYYEPDDIVNLAEKSNCKAIIYNLTEPTMWFEFMFRTAKIAQRSNIKNVFVTNGYISEEPVKKLTKYLDAATVNFTASLDPQFYEKFMTIKDISPMFEMLRQMRKHRVFVEITNLIVPQVGDSLIQFEKLVEHISGEIGSETPLHILQFHPELIGSELPTTSLATLEKFEEEAKKLGLRYVYLGNLFEHHSGENTYCHNCRELLIERKAGTVKKIKLLGDRCKNCGVKVNIFVE
jgi:pyruvate formate lyase activating enzyme